MTMTEKPADGAKPASGAAVGREPRPIPPAPEIELPETLKFRVKNKLLGPPLETDQLEHERLGIPVALAVFSSDCISSSAYATEEILRVLIPAIGLAAFSMVVPLTVAMIVVLVFLILSYRETIKEYPTAGGAYMVTRDNFGLLPAQVAGVSLLTDYVLTVAVSVSAGTAALVSAVPGLSSYAVPISLSFIALIAFGNLKGVRESGQVFAIPTYFFMGIMGLLLLVGFVKFGMGSLAVQSTSKKGMLPMGKSVSDAIFYGASLYVVAHAFASGGAAVTGVEAISNGVTAFKKPEWKNARVTLVIMGATLGTLFLGLSILASKVHAVPYTEGTPTVISQVGKLVFGTSAGGHALFLALQAGTLLILVLAANTSFADFPRLASFHAGDNFMPKQLTQRGHRLVFSNGILFLALTSAVLVVFTGAKVDRLIPLYAVGVFTSFTLSQSGMAKHHITKKEPGWKRGLAINLIGAVLSGIVTVIVLVTKFTHGAFIIVILVPIMVYLLTRLNKQYENEARQPQRRPPRRSCVGTWCSCSSVVSTRARLGPSNTPAHSRPTTCGRCTSPSTAGSRPIWPRNGSGSDSRGCPSSWSTAPTAGWSGPRSRSLPRRPPTARPRSRSSCRTGCTAGSGTDCSTTGRPTRSPRRWRACRTPT